LSLLGGLADRHRYSLSDKLMSMLDDKYHPRRFEEMADDPTPAPIINEPLPPENVTTLGRAKVRAWAWLPILRCGKPFASRETAGDLCSTDQGGGKRRGAVTS
jgi:hypothetical protein